MTQLTDTEIPGWIIEYNKKGFNSSAGRAISYLIHLIENKEAENASLKAERNMILEEILEERKLKEVEFEKLQQENETLKNIEQMQTNAIKELTREKDVLQQDVDTLKSKLEKSESWSAAFQDQSTRAAAVVLSLREQLDKAKEEKAVLYKSTEIAELREKNEKKSETMREIMIRWGKANAYERESEFTKQVWELIDRK